MTKSKLGRPREYDREAALSAATRTFHRQGYAGTSLHDLASAMKMNRPSLYNAFGDKEALYQSALGHFVEALTGPQIKALTSSADLAESLIAFYTAALDVYFAEDPACSCLVFCTAPAEAITNPAIAHALGNVIEQIDNVLHERFEQGHRKRQLAQNLHPKIAAMMAQAVLHTLALRVRAGASRRTLNKFVRAAVTHWCC